MATSMATAAAMEWLFKVSTNPDVESVLLDSIPHANWPEGWDRKMTSTIHDAIGPVIPGSSLLTGEAVARIKASIYLDPCLSLHMLGICRFADDVTIRSLGSLLCLTVGIPSNAEVLSWSTIRNPAFDLRWMSYILPYIPVWFRRSHVEIPSGVFHLIEVCLADHSEVLVSNGLLCLLAVLDSCLDDTEKLLTLPPFKETMRRVPVLIRHCYKNISEIFALISWQDNEEMTEREHSICSCLNIFANMSRNCDPVSTIAGHLRPYQKEEWRLRLLLLCSSTPRLPSRHAAISVLRHPLQEVDSWFPSYSFELEAQKGLLDALDVLLTMGSSKYSVRDHLLLLTCPDWGGFNLTKQSLRSISKNFIAALRSKDCSTKNAAIFALVSFKEQLLSLQESELRTQLSRELSNAIPQELQYSIQPLALPLRDDNLISAFSWWNPEQSSGLRYLCLLASLSKCKYWRKCIVKDGHLKKVSIIQAALGDPKIESWRTDCMGTCLHVTLLIGNLEQDLYPSITHDNESNVRLLTAHFGRDSQSHSILLDSEMKQIKDWCISLYLFRYYATLQSSNRTNSHFSSSGFNMRKFIDGLHKWDRFPRIQTIRKIVDGLHKEERFTLIQIIQRWIVPLKLSGRKRRHTICGEDYKHCEVTVKGPLRPQGT
ncbi:hypothetical protein M422DRAFT_51230 [Sphaerobolus stellatus SS14]|uniref:Uncharacterized protein n=1 Tax=Sphaerobolus stellatus (strain SS14) TaxID=990650 RepID=A0A0C9VEI9_SPHS4|nr:hypothetical protein M422DRAFT_51230 [Sphaerobolus stellatus SS14]